jgi:ketosteroid isomerase-like protein
MVEPHRVLVERLFDAFNRRDVPAMVEVCDERMEFHPVTAEEVGRNAPYVGASGLEEYLRDIATIWDELLILPKRIESNGNRMLVRGRVYLRSHQLGIRDIPAAWIWEVQAGRFIRGEVFVDPEQAASRFDAEAR